MYHTSAILASQASLLSSLCLSTPLCVCQSLLHPGRPPLLLCLLWAGEFIMVPSSPVTEWVCDPRLTKEILIPWRLGTMTQKPGGADCPLRGNLQTRFSGSHYQERQSCLDSFSSQGLVFQTFCAFYKQPHVLLINIFFSLNWPESVSVACNPKIYMNTHHLNTSMIYMYYSPGFFIFIFLHR